MTGIKQTTLTQPSTQDYSFSYQVQVLLVYSGQTEATPSTGLQSTEGVFKKEKKKKKSCFIKGPGLNTHVKNLFFFFTICEARSV